MSISIGQKIKGYSVVTPAKPGSDLGQGSFQSVADRRLHLKEVPKSLTAALVWDKRPQTEQGNPSWTYLVKSPNWCFAMVVGHLEAKGKCTPFEVWVMGEAPRGLAALAKSISMDLRTRDRAWLRKKLDSLAKCPGDAFDMTMPNGTVMRMPSEVAAFARLLTLRCEEMGVFVDAGETPLIDALMSKREPKTTTDGTMSWTVDIANFGTGDDLTLFLKEAVLPETGQRRPFSVWLAGNYPKSLDGLCKSISLDLRVMDPAWALKKLTQLEDNLEPMGGFMAQIPASEKSQWYPSTVAYIATLIKHRFLVLGLSDVNGAPVGKSALKVVESIHAKATPVAEQPKGSLCGQCGAFAVVKLDNCPTCLECSWSKCS